MTEAVSGQVVSRISDRGNGTAAGCLQRSQQWRPRRRFLARARARTGPPLRRWRAAFPSRLFPLAPRPAPHARPPPPSPRARDAVEEPDRAPGNLPNPRTSPGSSDVMLRRARFSRPMRTVPWTGSGFAPSSAYWVISDLPRGICRSHVQATQPSGGRGRGADPGGHFGWPRGGREGLTDPDGTQADLGVVGPMTTPLSDALSAQA